MAAIHDAGAAGKCSAAVPGAQQAALTAQDSAASDRLGRSVSISGETVIAGAHLDDDAGNDSGAAYVFTRSGTTWAEQAKLTAADGGSSDHFGYSVAIDGDVAVVGAPQDDDRALNGGAAYVFTRSGGAWTQQAKLTAVDGGQVDNFGRAVAVRGDTVLVGVLFDDDRGSNSGSAYVFTRSGTTWSQQAKLTAADGATGEAFGVAAALSGGTAVIGAPGDSDAGNASGAAFVFTVTGTVWIEQAKLVAPDAAAGDQFGIAVALDGATAVVGAHLDDVAGADSGSARVFVP